MHISLRLRILVLLVAGLLLPGLAQALPLLSNLGSPVNGTYGGNPDSGNGFTTGTQPMTVQSVTVLWGTGNGGVNRVGIYADNAGFPSTTQVGGFFTNPAPTASAASIVYSGSAVTLAANTKYWMVVDIGDVSRVAYTFTNTVVADPSTGGASMPAGSAFGDNVAGTWTADPASLMYALNGAPPQIPTLNEWGMIALFLMLALGAWGAMRRRGR